MTSYEALKELVASAPTEKVRNLAGLALALMLQRRMWKEDRGAGNVLETPASEHHYNVITLAVMAARDEVRLCLVPTMTDKAERERFDCIGWNLVH